MVIELRELADGSALTPTFELLRKLGRDAGVTVIKRAEAINATPNREVHTFPIDCLVSLYMFSLLKQRPPHGEAV